MNKGLKSEIGPPVFIAIIVVALVLILWFGWSRMKTSGEQFDAKAAVDEAAKHMAEKGIDIKTVPTWSDKWYQFHPEYKGPHPPVKMPDVQVNVPGAAPVMGAPGTRTATP